MVYLGAKQLRVRHLFVGNCIVIFKETHAFVDVNVPRVAHAASFFFSASSGHATVVRSVVRTQTGRGVEQHDELQRQIVEGRDLSAHIVSEPFVSKIRCRGGCQEGEILGLIELQIGIGVGIIHFGGALGELFVGECWRWCVVVTEGGGGGG